MPTSDTWDNPNPNSDPIADIQRFIKMVENERWICKSCAWTVRYPPRYGTLKCPACGHQDWYYTTRDPEEV